jgi:ferredoxin
MPRGAKGTGCAKGIARNVFALHDVGAVEVLIEDQLEGDDLTAVNTETERTCPVAAVHLTGPPQRGDEKDETEANRASEASRG